jgi:hypothetical protein
LTGAQFQSVSLYNKVLTLAEIQTIYDLSLAQFYETTAARYARILANTAFPAGLKSISATSTAYALGITDDSPNLTSELQLNNRTEGGLCFVNKSGVLTTKSRYEQFSYGYTDQLPLTSNTNTGFDSSINISLDADEMANDVAITWTNNNVDSITNTASVTAYGQKQQPFTTQLATYDEAIALANMKVGYVHPYHTDGSPLFMSHTYYLKNLFAAVGPEQVSPHYETLSRSRRGLIFAGLYVASINTISRFGGWEHNDWLRAMIWHHEFLLAYYIGYIEIRHFTFFIGPKFSIFYNVYSGYEY